MPDDLHRRYADAATTAHREWVPSTLENRSDRRTLGERIAEAILAVRDEELETARGIIKRLCEHQSVMEGHVDLAQQAAETESGLAKGWQERAEKAEAEREEEYQRAERLQEETGLLLGRAHNAERKLDRANEALMRVRGVLHEGRSDAETLAIIRRAIAGPLSERDRDLEEARRARETADIHWGRAEQRAEAAEEALDSSRTTLGRVIALARSLADTDPVAADLIAETIVGVPGECAPGAALALLDPPEPR